jgi:hypothetical protein
MAWEKRGDRKYYYRARRVGRRVVKEYVGTGPAAEAAAGADAERRAARAAKQRAEQQLREAYSTAAEQVAAFGSQVSLLMEAELLAAGYHRHDRGTWRKRRGTA